MFALKIQCHQFTSFYVVLTIKIRNFNIDTLIGGF